MSIESDYQTLANEESQKYSNAKSEQKAVDRKIDRLEKAKTSTCRPESSAKTILPVNWLIVSALRRAFSSKVIPVSATSGKSG